MIYNAYEILGVSETATQEEIDARYNELKEQYQKDRFAVGEAGEEASEKLQQLEVAYRDIMLEHRDTATHLRRQVGRRANKVGRTRHP